MCLCVCVHVGFGLCCFPRCFVIFGQAKGKEGARLVRPVDRLMLRMLMLMICRYAMCRIRS